MQSSVGGSAEAPRINLTWFPVIFVFTSQSYCRHLVLLLILLHHFRRLSGCSKLEEWKWLQILELKMLLSRPLFDLPACTDFVPSTCSKRLRENRQEAERGRGLHFAILRGGEKKKKKKKEKKKEKKFWQQSMLQCASADNYFHLLGCWYALEMQICKNLYNEFLDIFFDVFTP